MIIEDCLKKRDRRSRTPILREPSPKKPLGKNLKAVATPEKENITKSLIKKEIKKLANTPKCTKLNVKASKIKAIIEKKAVEKKAEPKQAKPKPSKKPQAVEVLEAPMEINLAQEKEVAKDVPQTKPLEMIEIPLEMAQSEAPKSEMAVEKRLESIRQMPAPPREVQSEFGIVFGKKAVIP